MSFLDEEGNMTWPEMLKFMFAGANSPDPQIKESALIIFRYNLKEFFSNLDTKTLAPVRPLYNYSRKFT